MTLDYNALSKLFYTLMAAKSNEENRDIIGCKLFKTPGSQIDSRVSGALVRDRN